MFPYMTYEAAKAALDAAVADVMADFGEEGAFAAHADLVRNICSDSSAAVAEELARREGVELISLSPLADLAEAAKPIPGRPGWRRDEQGREWYSSAWLDPAFASQNWPE